MLCVDFTVQKQKGSKDSITYCSLCSSSEKEPLYVMNNRFIHIDSATSVFLFPLFLSCPHVFPFVSSVWSGVTAGSALLATYSLQGFTVLLCINLQIIEHLYSAPVAITVPFFVHSGPIVN